MSSAVANEDLLTEDEKKAISLAGELYTLIVRKVIGNGRARLADAAEIAIHIHDIQNAILAQAAARAFPETYRLLGETIGDKHACTTVPDSSLNRSRVSP
jgi:hypothetical protein